LPQNSSGEAKGEAYTVLPHTTSWFYWHCGGGPKEGAKALGREAPRQGRRRDPQELLISASR